MNMPMQAITNHRKGSLAVLLLASSEGRKMRSGVVLRMLNNGNNPNKTEMTNPNAKP
jgi:hypothetical protein